MISKGIGLVTILMLVIGVAFVMGILPSIAQPINIMSEKQPVGSELITFKRNKTNATAPWCSINSSVIVNIAKSSYAETNCPVDNFVLKNGSNALTLVSGTDYNFNAITGGITFYNSTDMQQGCTSNSTYASYNYCGTGYARDSGTRAIVNIILIMACLAIVAYCIYWVFKDRSWDF